ncbi:MAG: hypothetical protein JWM68_4411, partial [Verrucomicrobiales bacterium]|nr:hypothetical protein [Verrucomicrobiales bacterium]
MKRIILAGGSGFIGQALARRLVDAGHDVVVLTRSPRGSSEKVREVAWDGKTVGAWKSELEGATAIINLSGRSVNCRYTPENRRAIMESRVFSTKVIGEAIAQTKTPPQVWMNASTATIYKHAIDVARDETGEIGATSEANDGFSVEVAHAWEAAFNEARAPHTRKI